MENSLSPSKLYRHTITDQACFGIESALKLVASTVLEVQAGLALPEQASLLEANTGAWGVASSEREAEQHFHV